METCWKEGEHETGKLAMQVLLQLEVVKAPDALGTQKLPLQPYLWTEQLLLQLEVVKIPLTSSRIQLAPLQRYLGVDAPTLTVAEHEPVDVPLVQDKE